MRRLMRELKELRMNPPEGIRVQLSEESVLDLVGIIEGPGEFSDARHFDRHSTMHFAEGTPYQGGYFRVKFEFTDEFPATPPRCMGHVPRD
jgi:ubiquitin-conjugating enzyme E2 S